MRFRILGPLEVEGAASLGGRRPRALLRTLLLCANETVPPERLIDAVWGEAPPETARHALQVYLSQLRKAIPDGHERIHTGYAGYRIVAGEDELDALRFQRLAREGRDRLAAGEAASASAALGEALALWRGPVEGADPLAAGLESLRLAAQEDRVQADLDQGRYVQTVPELERLVAEHPLRERLRGQLMVALYGAGRQADALAVYAQARATLVEELGLEPGPELRELEAAILRQDPGLVRPAAAAQVRLPAPVTPLVGRRREIGEIRELLEGGARIVTVTGPGGTGKTRVGLQSAQELAERFPDGVVFVGLAALREPGLVAGEIAATLEIEAGSRDPEQALREHLSSRTVLLLLDNFEQVDEAAPLLSRLLSAAAGLRLLVTSRRPLRIYGEYEYPLPPLRLEDEAVPLFRERARAGGAQLPADEAVAHVCEALDRLPLAIELAAARARHLAPAEMLVTLSRLELASGGPRDAPDRHRALQATIAWSHDLLDESLQRVFASLAVFAGGWDAAGAAAVAGATPAELAELVTHSLIGEHEGRFSMFETIREFAGARLDAAVAAAHAAHYLELVERATERMREGLDQSLWLDRLESEHDNLRAALAWLGDHDPRGELRMAGTMTPFWAVRGHAAEGLERLTRALERGGGGRTPYDAHALVGVAMLAWMRGDAARSRTCSERALALYRDLGDEPGIVRALANLGFVAMQAGDHTEARTLYEECLTVARRGGSRRSITIALNCLLELGLASRDLERARSIGEEGLALSREAGDKESTAVALLSLGYVALHQDRAGEARGLLREGVHLFRELGDAEVTAHALNGLAAACADDPEAAARLLGAAAALRDVVGGAHDFEPAVREGALATVKAMLGERFAEVYEEGRAHPERVLSGL